MSMRFLAPILVLVSASAAVASVTHTRHPAQTGAPELVASVKKPFSITGVPVTGLYPGASRPLTVKVTNPYTFAIKIGPVTARVRSSNRPGCTAAATNLTATAGGSRSLPIGAHRSKTVVLHVAMPSTVSNACQGARFTLSFGARATRA
ncbi:MAG TPA: hypothetical protein VH459_07590 [Gaiellales bacterium]|jgi:hypothetical protein